MPTLELGQFTEDLGLGSTVEELVSYFGFFQVKGRGKDGGGRIECW